MPRFCNLDWIRRANLCFNFKHFKALFQVKICSYCLLIVRFLKGIFCDHTRHYSSPSIQGVVNEWHWADVVLMLGQRHRRWPSIKTTLAQCHITLPAEGAVKLDCYFIQCIIILLLLLITVIRAVAAEEWIVLLTMLTTCTLNTHIHRFMFLLLCNIAKVQNTQLHDASILPCKAKK